MHVEFLQNLKDVRKLMNYVGETPQIKNKTKNKLAHNCIILWKPNVSSPTVFESETGASGILIQALHEYRRRTRTGYNNWTNERTKQNAKENKEQKRKAYAWKGKNPISSRNCVPTTKPDSRLPILTKASIWKLPALREIKSYEGVYFYKEVVVFFSDTTSFFYQG